MAGSPYVSVFARQKPLQCTVCGCGGGSGKPCNCNNNGKGNGNATPPTTAVPATTGNGNGNKMDHAARKRPGNQGFPVDTPTWFRALFDGSGAYCEPYGAPYPCRPFMDPSDPDKVYGCNLPCSEMNCSFEEAVKKLCWVETTLRSPAPVAAGDTITFSIEVKWWFQIQKILNLGDQTVATFDLTNIGYGQSNYNLEILNYLIDGVGTPQNGIDVRRWNIEMFDKYYPMPAMGLNDPLELEFTNVSGISADLELVTGGPAVLQIG